MNVGLVYIVLVFLLKIIINYFNSVFDPDMLLLSHFLTFRYVEAKSDRVTVVFSTVFKDDDDIVIGKVFMQVWLMSYQYFFVVYDKFLSCIGNLIYSV